MKTLKIFLWSLLSLCLLSTMTTVSMYAQETTDIFEAYRQSIENTFESTKVKHDKTFENYRDSINNAFSEYLRKEWDNTSLCESLPNPFKPEPKPIVDTDPIIESRPLPHIDIPVIQEDTIPKPAPLIPVAPSDEIPDITPDNTPIIKPELFVFSFYGIECQMHLPQPRDLYIDDISPNGIGAAWDILMNDKYDSFMNDCISYCNALALSDWGVYQFTIELTREYFGDPDCNEAVLMQMYILSQMGYKVRLGMQGNSLINLVAFNELIFSAPYLEIDGDEFYYLSSQAKEGGIQICNYAFPKETKASLRIANLPTFPSKATPVREIKSSAYPNVKVSTSVNRNLIDFLNTYPCCSWELFAGASLSEEVKEQIYPALRNIIRQADEVTAANVILNLIQTGFEYMTDDEQFGREKTFFGDEPFFYPYCDCEDRSILFSILIRDLLGLDVVLLDYPSHIATAVRFNTDVPGDYFNLNGDKYVICDPTYIGAPIGKAMPDMLNVEANILRIN